MSQAVAITPEIVAEHGIRPEEYAVILDRLGREPNIVELGIFSVMWSEHCAYKHSKRVLKCLPTTGERVVVGPGENAGIVDIGHGLCVAFKMESHNHPSAVEPKQGAATGVGGILRDIFTMGARPIAMLDSLRFGDPSDPHMQHLIEGVIEGIAGYGNCVGVPTVAGDIAFDEGYNGNILVNAMCVGLVEKEHVIRGRATGPGNLVLYFGSATGRDGIHGATFASEELNEQAVERRGAVQVGDPFMGKKILEATLELIHRGLVVGIQDMGAAGLTCSTSEMAGRAGTGIDVDLDLVPQRAESMSAYEIMLSESQERMLAVCTPQNVDAALEVCARWECGGAIVGTVTESNRMVIRHRGSIVADIPVAPLTDDAPLYSPEARRATDSPAELQQITKLEPEEFKARLLSLIASPTVASKRWAFRRYDHQVQANTVLLPGEADAAVVRVPGSGDRPEKFLALKSDGNARYVALDPRRGGQLAVCEAARNIVCTGAEPIGLTNCLNFGSPEKPEVFHTFKECVEGMAEACELLRIPVTGGNVSLYNESNGVAIPPTPMIGMVGLIENPSAITPAGFPAVGMAVMLLGADPQSGIGSEYEKLHQGAASRGGLQKQALECFDLASEVSLQSSLLAAIRRGFIASAHDVSDGGLAGCLAECCLMFRSGAHVDPAVLPLQNSHWFWEMPPRVVVSCLPQQVDAVLEHFGTSGVPVRQIGHTIASGLEYGDMRITREELERAYSTHPWKGPRP